MHWLSYLALSLGGAIALTKLYVIFMRHLWPYTVTCLVCLHQLMEACLHPSGGAVDTIDTEKSVSSPLKELPEQDSSSQRPAQQKSYRIVKGPRHYIRRQLNLLSSGGGSKAQRTIWFLYCYLVSPAQREIDPALDSKSTALPRWMETVITMYYNRYIFWTILALFFYVFIVFTSHLWLYRLVGGLDQPPAVAQLYEDIKHATDGASKLDYCGILSPTNNSSSSHCYIRSGVDELALLPTSLAGEGLLASYLLGRGSRLSFPESAPLLSFVDQSSRRYYPMHVIARDEAGTVVTVQKYVEHNALVTQLNRIKASEEKITATASSSDADSTAVLSKAPATKKTGNICVCPAFLDIVSDLVFLFDRDSQQWVIMHRPVIVRNNSFSELVASTLDYNERSRFHARHRQFQDALQLREVVHQTAFTVEYTEDLVPTLPHENALIDEDLRDLRELNKRMADFYHGINADTRRQRPLLLYKNTEYERKKVPFSQENAVCYAYCTSVNSKIQKGVW